MKSHSVLWAAVGIGALALGYYAIIEQPPALAPRSPFHPRQSVPVGSPPDAIATRIGLWQLSELGYNPVAIVNTDDGVIAFVRDNPTAGIAALAAQATRGYVPSLLESIDSVYASRFGLT